MEEIQDFYYFPWKNNESSTFRSESKTILQFELNSYNKQPFVSRVLMHTKRAEQVLGCINTWK